MWTQPILFTRLIKHPLRHSGQQTAKSCKNHLKMNKNTNDKHSPLMQLLTQTPVVINVGLEGFANDLESQQATVTHLDWRPPAGGDAELADLLSRLGG